MPKAETAPAPEDGAKATRIGKVRILGGAKPLDQKYEYVNGLWTGPLGTGKTTAVATMANLGPVIYINAEGGLKKKPLQARGINVANIRVLPEDPEDLGYKWLDDLYWEIKASLSEDPDSIAGVVWDSLTEIHQKVLRDVVDYQVKRATARGESRLKGADPGDMLNENFTDLGDYGIMTGQLRLLLRRYRDLPCHFAVTALDRRDVDGDGRVVYRPAMTPALAGDLESYVDVVAVTSIKEYEDGEDDEYRGLFRPAGKYRGKDRFGVMPKVTVDPSFERVVHYVNDVITPDTDDIQAAAAQRAQKAKAKSEAAQA